MPEMESSRVNSHALTRAIHQRLNLTWSPRKTASCSLEKKRDKSISPPRRRLAHQMDYSGHRGRPRFRGWTERFHARAQIRGRHHHRYQSAYYNRSHMGHIRASSRRSPSANRFDRRLSRTARQRLTHYSQSRIVSSRDRQRSNSNRRDRSRSRAVSRSLSPSPSVRENETEARSSSPDISSPKGSVAALPTSPQSCPLVEAGFSLTESEWIANQRNIPPTMVTPHVVSSLSSDRPQDSKEILKTAEADLFSCEEQRLVYFTNQVEVDDNLHVESPAPIIGVASHSMSVLVSQPYPCAAAETDDQNAVKESLEGPSASFDETLAQNVCYQNVGQLKSDGTVELNPGIFNLEEIYLIVETLDNDSTTNCENVSQVELSEGAGNKLDDSRSFSLSGNQDVSYTTNELNQIRADADCEPKFALEDVGKNDASHDLGDIQQFNTSGLSGECPPSGSSQTDSDNVYKQGSAKLLSINKENSFEKLLKEETPINNIDQPAAEAHPSCFSHEECLIDKSIFPLFDMGSDVLEYPSMLAPTCQMNTSPACNLEPGIKPNSSLTESRAKRPRIPSESAMVSCPVTSTTESIHVEHKSIPGFCELDELECSLDSMSKSLERKSDVACGTNQPKMTLASCPANEIDATCSAPKTSSGSPMNDPRDSKSCSSARSRLVSVSDSDDTISLSQGEHNRSRAVSRSFSPASSSSRERRRPLTRTPSPNSPRCRSMSKLHARRRLTFSSRRRNATCVYKSSSRDDPVIVLNNRSTSTSPSACPSAPRDRVDPARPTHSLRMSRKRKRSSDSSCSSRSSSSQAGVRSRAVSRSFSPRAEKSVHFRSDVEIIESPISMVTSTPRRGSPDSRGLLLHQSYFDKSSPSPPASVRGQERARKPKRPSRRPREKSADSSDRSSANARKKSTASRLKGKKVGRFRKRPRPSTPSSSSSSSSRSPSTDSSSSSTDSDSSSDFQKSNVTKKKLKRKTVDTLVKCGKRRQINYHKKSLKYLNKTQMQNIQSVFDKLIKIDINNIETILHEHKMGAAGKSGDQKDKQPPKEVADTSHSE